jgi:hypothetical protein
VKEGRKSKDALIADEFNLHKKGGLSKAEQRAARMQKAQDDLLKRKQAQELLDIKKKLGKVEDRLEGVSPEEPEKEEPSEAKDEDDAKSAYKMLQDMRWVYRNVSGRRKLKELVEGDDKQFVFMVKELMRIEAALLSAKIRKTGEEGDGKVNQNFFVVLKGLEEDKKVLDLVSKDIDLKQISRATNPDGTEMTE